MKLRPYPYPYEAMLAICSDLDETPNGDVYFECAKYLNTDEHTRFGPGLNLEVGNTLYFGMPEGEFSFYNASDEEKSKLIELIKSGHIDCIHSFGDHISKREEIEHIWQVLEDNGCTIKVWVDHAVAPSNFDSDIMKGQGAVKGSDCYHADLTLGKGVEYVWKGRVTSLVAQNRPISFAGIYNSKHHLASIKTMAKEALKVCLGSVGHVKYAMHGKNRLMRKATLVDGSPVIEFMRSNPSWKGVSSFETADGVSEVLTEPMLNQLCSAGGATVLYTHLGKYADPEWPFNSETVKAFKRLKSYVDSGKIKVTTTRRLLDYCRAVEEIDWESSETDKSVKISLKTNLPLIALQGLTWYIKESQSVEIWVNGIQCNELTYNRADKSNQVSVSLTWKNLSFPS